MKTDVLFRPLNLGNIELKNRIVMAPMTRSRSPNGIPGSDVAEYYARRAAGGVGLILSEGTVIARATAKNDPAIPDFHGTAALDGWQRVIKSVQANGGKMGPQLWHMGAMPSLVEGWNSVEPMESPSGLTAPGQRLGNAMRESDIADSIAAFARAAAQAKALGFDVLELHGAHGYLIDQFFWDGTNRREDRYGGATLALRSRYAVEIIRAVRAAVGPGFPIILRISQWKLQDYEVKLANSPSELAAWLMPLVEAGVDVLHCSQRRFWQPEFPAEDGADGLNLAGWAKKLTGAVTISVGSVGLSNDVLATFAGQSAARTGLDLLVQRMERGDFDLIAVGRMLLQDPEWVAKVKSGESVDPDHFDPAALATLS